MDEKEILRIGLECLLFRDNSGKIYSENNTNNMVLEISKVLGIIIIQQTSVKDSDSIISEYRKIFKNKTV